MDLPEASPDVFMHLRDLHRIDPVGTRDWYRGQPLFFIHPLTPHPLYAPTYLAPYCYDLRHPANAIAATAARYARRMPDADPAVMNEFRAFAEAALPILFEPPQKSTLKTYDEWLRHANYPAKRKEYLYALRRKTFNICERTMHNDSFIKAEIYQKRSKNPRAINSYSDVSKVMLGPLFHAIDKATFRSHYFVKGTNPRDWPSRLLATFADGPVISTDFTSFEAHHTGVFAEVVYAWFVHMTRDFDLPETTRMIVRRLMLGRNIIKFANLNVECNQRLMSGALWTSSANGVLNLLINGFLAARAALPNASPLERAQWLASGAHGLVEGDDGLFKDVGQDDAVAAALGCVLKVERFESCAGAGFCGIICDPVEQQIVKDPIKFLRNFFVLPARYAKSKPHVWDQLLRAKALSYYVTYRNSPIIGPICAEVLRRTSHVTAKSDGLEIWKRDQLDAAIAFRAPDGRTRLWNLPSEPAETTRALMGKYFGIDVAEQLRIESQFREDPRSVDLSMFSTADDREYIEKYVRPEPLWLGHDLFFPQQTLARLRECRPTPQRRRLVRRTYPHAVNEWFKQFGEFELDPTPYNKSAI